VAAHRDARVGDRVGGHERRALRARLGARVGVAGAEGGDAKLADLDAMLAADGEGAVMRALGGDISVGLLGVDLAGGLEPAADAVLVATEADGAALLRELARLGFAEGPAIDGTPVWAQGASTIAVDGSLVVGATSRATLREALEVRAGQAPSLADEAAFRATVERLPDDPLALAYLSPARLAPLAQAAAALVPAQESGDLPNAQAQITDLVAALGDVRGLGIAVRAEAGGLRVAAAGDADEAADRGARRAGVGRGEEQRALRVRAVEGDQRVLAGQGGPETLAQADARRGLDRGHVARQLRRGRLKLLERGREARAEVGEDERARGVRRHAAGQGRGERGRCGRAAGGEGRLVAALGDVRGLGIAVRAEAGGLRVPAASSAPTRRPLVAPAVPGSG
ncbi:MAG: hypothetical protein ACKOSO_08480, partial [Actinomycetota bacterium]